MPCAHGWQVIGINVVVHYYNQGRLKDGKGSHNNNQTDADIVLHG